MDKSESSEEDSDFDNDVRDDSGMLFDDLNTSDIINDYEEQSRADKDQSIEENADLDTSDLDAYLKSNDDDQEWLELKLIFLNHSSIVLLVFFGGGFYSRKEYKKYYFLVFILIF